MLFQWFLKKINLFQKFEYKQHFKFVDFDDPVIPRKSILKLK